jgi:hypothetical protein
MPMALWPHGFDLGQLGAAWSRTHIQRFFLRGTGLSGALKG